MNSTHFLVQFRQLNKLYECMLKEICRRHKLTLIETTIISFLYNNPGRDTAADIVELRMLSKGNVSQAVELLIQKSLLKRIPDEMTGEGFILSCFRMQFQSRMRLIR